MPPSLPAHVERPKLSQGSCPIFSARMWQNHRLPSLMLTWEGLDRPYTELVQLLEQRGSMPRSEFDRHARDIGLLPDGAIEQINDWSFDRFDDALIEDGDVVVLAPHLRGRLSEMKDKAA